MAKNKTRDAKSVWIAFSPEFEEWWGELGRKATSLGLDVFGRRPLAIPLLDRDEQKRFLATRVNPYGLVDRMAGSASLADMAKKARIVDIQNFGQGVLHGVVGSPPENEEQPKAWGLGSIREDFRDAVVPNGSYGGVLVNHLREANILLGEAEQPAYAEHYREELVGSDVWRRRPTEQVISGLVIRVTAGEPIFVPLGG